MYILCRDFSFKDEESNCTQQISTTSPGVLQQHVVGHKIITQIHFGDCYSVDLLNLRLASRLAPPLPAADKRYAQRPHSLSCKRLRQSDYCYANMLLWLPLVVWFCYLRTTSPYLRQDMQRCFTGFANMSRKKNIFFIRVCICAFLLSM